VSDRSFAAAACAAAASALSFRIAFVHRVICKKSRAHNSNYECHTIVLQKQYDRVVSSFDVTKRTSFGPLFHFTVVRPGTGAYNAWALQGVVYGQAPSFHKFRCR
jgi:hypothetical protein